MREISILAIVLASPQVFLSSLVSAVPAAGAGAEAQGWLFSEAEINDTTEQRLWQEEHDRLWNIGRNNSKELRTLDEVLEDRNCRRHNEILQRKASELSQRFEEFKTRIEKKMTDLTSKLNSAPSHSGETISPPVGAILSWVTRVGKEDTTTVPLPDGWQRCDGSIIERGPWAGQYTPDLNNERRFLRGGPDRDQLSLEEDQVQDHTHHIHLKDPGHGHSHVEKFRDWKGNGLWSFKGTEAKTGRWDAPHVERTEESLTGISAAVAGVLSGRVGKETRPRNMNVIFIIRVY